MRLIFTLLTVLCTIYGPAELTRVILAYCKAYTGGLIPFHMWVELTVMWSAYTIAIFTIYKGFKYI